MEGYAPPGGGDILVLTNAYFWEANYHENIPDPPKGPVSGCLRRRCLPDVLCDQLPRRRGRSASQRQLPIYCVQRDQKLASVSFDAAWGNEDTQQLIDILAKYQVQATFFVVGDWVDKYPESVLALHEAGHEVMNHSNTHATCPNSPGRRSSPTWRRAATRSRRSPAYGPP